MGQALLNWLAWNRDTDVLAEGQINQIDVGAVLVEISDKLPEHLFAHWRVERRFNGPGEMPHIALRNISDPYAHKLLSLSSLLAARRFQLLDGAAGH